MPIHDWTRVDAGIFHAFHQGWIPEISRALNRGLLPADYYALPEQLAGRMGPDVLTLHRPAGGGTPTSLSPSEGGLAVAVEPPKVRIRVRSAANRYAAKANAIVVRHVSSHEVVAMAEIVSPGNKNNRNGLEAFVRKAREALAAGVHLLVIDLFPPSSRDPRGIHPAIWGDDDAQYDPPEDKSLTCASYVGGPDAQAYIEPMAVGDLLTPMPLFLTPDVYVPVPLEATYQAAWEGMPSYWRDVLAGEGE